MRLLEVELGLMMRQEKIEVTRILFYQHKNLKL